MDGDGHQGAERGKSGGAAFGAFAVEHHLPQALAVEEESDPEERRAEDPGRREVLEPVGVGVAPETGDGRRLHQREGGLEAPQARADEREETEEIERRPGGLDAIPAAELVDRARGKARERAFGPQRGDRHDSGEPHREPAGEKPLAAAPAADDHSLHRQRRERRKQRGARAGEHQTAEEQKEDDRRRSDAEQAILGPPAVEKRAPHRPPDPGERHHQRDLEEERQVVRIDEAAAQARSHGRERHSPESAGARDPLHDAERDLHGAGEEQGAAERPPYAARRPEPGGGEEAGGGDEPVERRGAARRRRERRSDAASALLGRPAGGAAGELIRLRGEAHGLGREEAGDRGRQGQGLQAAERDDRR